MPATARTPASPVTDVDGGVVGDAVAAGEGEEMGEVARYFGVEYDVSAALRLTGGRVDIEIDVASWARQRFAAERPADLLDPTRGIALLADRVDVDYALGHKAGHADVDVSRPVLVCCETGPDGAPFAQMIDGRHRLYRAWWAGLEKLPASVLTAEELATVRTDRRPGPRR